MSMISEQIEELRLMAEMFVNGEPYGNLLRRAAGTIEMLSEKVRADRPQGKWEEKETFSVVDNNPIIERWQSARCSMCERYHTTPYMYYFNDYNYCPYCGARMKGADDERL